MASLKQSTTVPRDRQICINSDPQQHDKGTQRFFLEMELNFSMLISSSAQVLFLFYFLYNFFFFFFLAPFYSLYAINILYDYLQLDDSPQHLSLSLIEYMSFFVDPIFRQPNFLIFGEWPTRVIAGNGSFLIQILNNDG